MAYHYTECGLRNVYIYRFWPESEDGEEIVIPLINQLHQLITKELVKRDRILEASEFRFLRTQLGISTYGLAKIMPYSYATLKSWEDGNSPVAGPGDALLRMLVIERLGLPGRGGVEGVMGRIVLNDDKRRIKILFRDTRYEVQDVPSAWDQKQAELALRFWPEMD